MGTSKSDENQGSWIGGAFVYSGRRDPTWSIPGLLAKKLQQLWESLPTSDEKRELRPEGLGYRGAFVRGPGHRVWVASKGLVSLTTPTGVEVRKDPAASFEKALLSSAPEGLLPKDALTGGWSAA